MDQQAHKGFSQSTLKFFIRHMAGATRRQVQREEKIAGFESQITMLKRSAMAPKPSRQKIEAGFDDLGSKIKEVIQEERVLVLNQQKEEKVIEEIKERLQLLEERVYGMGHVHSMAVQEHMKRIDEMSRRIRELTSGIAERKAPEERKIEQHAAAPVRYLDRKKKEESIRMLEAMIKDAERKHKELSRKKMPKKHLDSIKKLIDAYKKRLNSLKA